MADSLNERQKRFIAEYLIDLNATQAAIRSGYSARTAEVQGHRLLSYAKIVASVAKAQEKRSKRTDITADRVLQELARIGFADIRKAAGWNEDAVYFVPSGEIDDDTAGAISEVAAKTKTYTTKDGVTEKTIEMKLKFSDKVSALDKLGRHLGIFGNESSVDAAEVARLVREDLRRQAEADDLDAA